MAAESLRSGGSFASGPNAAGISGATGASGTFTADPEGGSKVSRYEGKKPEAALGKPDAQVKSKAGQVGSVSRQRGLEKESARGSSHTAGSQSSQPPDSTGSKHRGGGGGEAPLNTGTNPKAFSGMGAPSEGKVGESAEDVDWSKISKDTNATTNIGGEDDPGRLAEQKMYKKTTTHGGENTGALENSFGQLDEEGI